MKRALTWSLAWMLTLSPFTATAGGRHPEQMKVTATTHGITYTWTASTSSFSGLGYNLYIGTTSGGESSTPVNSSLIAVGCSGATCAYTYANVVPLATYYAVLAACVPSGTTNFCSAKTPEVAATIPLGAGDIASPAGFTGSAF